MQLFNTSVIMLSVLVDWFYLHRFVFAANDLTLLF